MDNQRLTLADQVLVNALAFLVVTPFRTDLDYEMMLSVVGEVLGQVNYENPHMAPLIVAATDLRDAKKNPARTGALDAAGHALATFFKWRSGLALDAMRARAGMAA